MDVSCLATSEMLSVGLCSFKVGVIFCGFFGKFVSQVHLFECHFCFVAPSEMLTGVNFTHVEWLIICIVDASVFLCISISLLSKTQEFYCHQFRQ
jgi:hypothetical protein